MPRVVPHLGKDVNFEAFCSAFAERQVVFVRSAERQARKPRTRRRRIGLSLLRQLYSDMASVRSIRSILPASLAFFCFNVCTGELTCDVQTQSEIEKIELRELEGTCRIQFPLFINLTAAFPRTMSAAASPPAMAELAYSYSCCACHPGVQQPATPTAPALDRLLGSTRTPPGSWYASFVLQRSRKALSEFLAQTIPAGAPKFLVERSPRNGSAAIKLPKHSNAAWVFFGRNPGSRILRGRPEHTDAIQHSGTWHVQLKGEKVWTLKPTDELRRKVPSLKKAGRVRVRCMEGDVLCINTRLWWHSTHIPARCKLSLSVARDMYLDGTRPGACDMTNVDGHYALKPIQKGAVIFTEDTAPQLQLPRSSTSNCELRESQRGSLVVVAKRPIKKGEWFSLSDSDVESTQAEEPRGTKRRQ
ncbi:unnamed protein product [Symbiodinium necroappetens]|uniref:Uncharacterized protein n=1 Tax=Symbiodinium necroappetens TaxID=1628268 RepID=A0A813C1X3_9DINO|nr:unnamed protein product [Symbiodinium necroappetens]